MEFNCILTFKNACKFRTKFWVRLFVLIYQSNPSVIGLTTTINCIFLEISINFFWNFKWSMVPTQVFSCSCCFIWSKRSTVNTVSSLFIRSTMTNDSLNLNQRWFTTCFCTFNSSVDSFNICSILNKFSVPTISFITCTYIFSK